MINKYRYKKHKNIKTLVLMVMLLLVCSAGFVLLKGNSKTTKANLKNTTATSFKQGAVIVGKNNNVTFEENKYFKKYSISLKNDQKDIKWTENDKNVTIELSNTSIDKITVRDEDKKIAKNITFSIGKSNKTISISKTYKNNYVWKNEADNKTVEVLISKIEKPSDYKVVIDPGHGGFDPGTNLKGILEKDITLKISKNIEKYLIYNGCNTVLTRTKDALPEGVKNAKEDLRSRWDIINKEKPDACVSIHINSFKDSKYSGITTYYYTPKGEAQEKRQQLASFIQKEAIKSDGWNNRGILSDNLALTRIPNIPCALIECGFITNDGDRERMTNNKVVDNLSKNIANGIVKYVSSEKH